jgi:hypothetical protein
MGFIETRPERFDVKTLGTLSLMLLKDSSPPPTTIPNNCCKSSNNSSKTKADLTKQ